MAQTPRPLNECVTWHKGTRKKEGKNADEKRQAETQETKQKGGDRWEIEGERSKKTNKQKNNNMLV